MAVSFQAIFLPLSPSFSLLQYLPMGLPVKPRQPHDDHPYVASTLDLYHYSSITYLYSLPSLLMPSDIEKVRYSELAKSNSTVNIDDLPLWQGSFIIPIIFKVLFSSLLLLLMSLLTLRESK
jgi:hypothetical protein